MISSFEPTLPQSNINMAERYQRSLNDPPFLFSRSPLTLTSLLNYCALSALVHHNSICPMRLHRLDGENRTLTRQGRHRLEQPRGPGPKMPASGVDFSTHTRQCTHRRSIVVG